MYALFDPMSLPGGVRLPYVESGDRDGTPVLMLHGLGESRRAFEPVLSRLPESIRAVAATQRGHGDAAKPVAGYGLEQYVGDALALLDRLRIGRAVVVGHSLGAWVAERLAIERPDRVGGLLLTGIVSPAGANRAHAEPFAGRGAIDPSDGLERIAAPTRLIWGDRDEFADRAEQAALLAAIRGAGFRVYEGAGHAPHREQPQRFATELTSFVASCEADAGRSGPPMSPAKGRAAPRTATPV
jgi:non-heme chloroperoxidase